MSVGGVHEVILFGPISPKFRSVHTGSGMGLQFISTAKERQGKLGRVEVGAGMRPESPSLLENTRDVKVSAGSQGSSQWDKERRRRAIILSDTLEPGDRKRP